MSIAPIITGDPLDAVDYTKLTKRHPEGELWQRKWDDYRLLYKGGEEFLLAAGQQTLTRASINSLTTPLYSWNDHRGKRRFLHQLEGEPNVTYFSRWERAMYLPYIAAIIDYFRHWLFSEPPTIRPVDDEDPPEWYQPFSDNADGTGKNFLDFVRDSVLDVLILRRAGWLIGTPGAAAESQDNGVILTSYGFEEIYDWQDGPNGLDWIVLKKCKHIRRFPEDRVKVETFTYLDRDRWRAWECYQSQQQQQQLEIIGEGTHGLGEVPFVMLEIPEGLWPMNKLASWQIDLFNKQSMLANAQLLSCFLQPFIKSNDMAADSRIFGENILLRLMAGRGDDPGEEFGWKAPDNIAPLEFCASQLKEERDEGYRIVHQMSLAVDSQAVGAVARSGASKIEDRKATEVILQAYGGYVRETIIRTCNLLSMTYGDRLTWECMGLDTFSVSSLQEELEQAALLSTLNIPSPTFEKQTLTNLATGRLLGHASESTKQDIVKEISDAIDLKQEARQLQQEAMLEQPMPEPAAPNEAKPNPLNQEEDNGNQPTA